MTNLGLSIASCYLASNSFIIVKSFVLFSAHQFDVFDEHAKMSTTWNLMRIFPEVIDPEMVRQNIRGLVLGTVVVEKRKVPVCVLDEFDPAFVVQIRSIGQGWTRFSDTFHVEVVLLPVEETS